MRVIPKKDRVSSFFDLEMLLACDWMAVDKNFNSFYFVESVLYE